MKTYRLISKFHYTGNIYDNPFEHALNQNKENLEMDNCLSSTISKKRDKHFYYLVTGIFHDESENKKEVN